MQRVPVGVDLAKGRAANLVPVALGIGNAGNRKIFGWAAYRPASLSNPDGFAADSGNCVVIGLPEGRVAVLDRIFHGVLEVRVCVSADEVAVVNNSLVRSIDPGGPGIHMTDGYAGEWGSSDDFADLLYVARNNIRASTHTGFVRDASW